MLLAEVFNQVHIILLNRLNLDCILSFAFIITASEIRQQIALSF